MESPRIALGHRGPQRLSTLGLVRVWWFIRSWSIVCYKLVSLTVSCLGLDMWRRGFFLVSPRFSAASRNESNWGGAVSGSVRLQRTQLGDGRCVLVGDAKGVDDGSVAC